MSAGKATRCSECGLGVEARKLRQVQKGAPGPLGDPGSRTHASWSLVLPVYRLCSPCKKSVGLKAVLAEAADGSKDPP